MGGTSLGSSLDTSGLIFTRRLQNKTSQRHLLLGIGTSLLEINYGSSFKDTNRASCRASASSLYRCRRHTNTWNIYFSTGVDKYTRLANTASHARVREFQPTPWLLWVTTSKETCRYRSEHLLRSVVGKHPVTETN